MLLRYTVTPLARTCAPRLNMPTSTSLSVPLLCYEDLLAAALPQLQQQQAAGGFRWTQVDEFDACGMCYTSGTTGNPKVRAAWVKTHVHHDVHNGILRACRRAWAALWLLTHVLRA